MSGSEVVLYRTDDGLVRVDCRFEEERVWLTQAQMAELYQTTPQNITQHLRAIYVEGELSPSATCKEYLQVRREGRRRVSRTVLHYDLSAIVAVGLRVRSPRGTQFRQWAIERLGEYLLKGFTMDDARLKNPPGPGVPDYFDEQLARIRDIRASERRVYTLQYVATGQTAPEIIRSRADASAPNMGLTTWKQAPQPDGGGVRAVADRRADRRRRVRAGAGAAHAAVREAAQYRGAGGGVGGGVGRGRWPRTEAQGHTGEGA